MNNELLQALRDLEKERGIDFDVLVEAIEAALISAYKKNFGANQNVNVNFDQLSGEFKVYHRKDVVEEVEDPKLQISVEEAKAIKPVSYTHLDVYKRQAGCCTSMASGRLRLAGGFFMPNPEAQKQCIFLFTECNFFCTISVKILIQPFAESGKGTGEKPWRKR